MATQAEVQVDTQTKWQFWSANSFEKKKILNQQINTSAYVVRAYTWGVGKNQPQDIDDQVISKRSWS